MTPVSFLSKPGWFGFRVSVHHSASRTNGNYLRIFLPVQIILVFLTVKWSRKPILLRRSTTKNRLQSRTPWIWPGLCFWQMSSKTFAGRSTRLNESCDDSATLLSIRSWLQVRHDSCYFSSYSSLIASCFSSSFLANLTNQDFFSHNPYRYYG